SPGLRARHGARGDLRGASGGYAGERGARPGWCAMRTLPTDGGAGRGPGSRFIVAARTPRLSARGARRGDALPDRAGQRRGGERAAAAAVALSVPTLPGAVR